VSESQRIHLATGIAIRGEAILLVASTYASHPEPLWNLPGGRQVPGELLSDALAREVREETSLDASVADVAYVSESYDGSLHVLNTAFEISVTGTLAIPQSGDHVVDARWFDLSELESVLSVAVVRIPLLHYLRHGKRYSGFSDAGITISWPQEA
jgi:ADP-ribose pyrophosphatase YjhB (NUDIX family)